MSIILASKSPRRQELFGRLGLEFTVRTADVDERMDPNLPPEQEVARVSALKAAKIAEECPDDLIVSADTIVVIDGLVLGKPKDEADAARMLRLLSGRTHEVMTGLCVRQGKTVRQTVSRTCVTFRPLTETEILSYIRTGEPMDKAGSYGVQGLGSVLVSHLDGDFFSVMGLPLCELCTMLRQFGLPILGI